MNEKRLAANLIVSIMLLSLFSSIAISEDTEKQIDEDFMQDIIEDLTGIIDNSEYWQGRYFGTSGEIKSADILYNSLNNVAPKIEFNDLQSKYKQKIGIHAQDDVFLEIGDQIIPDSEIFPMFSPSHSEKIHKFENAKILSAPSIVYNLKCDNVAIHSRGKIRDNHIYLLDMSYFENDYDIYISVLKLFLYTRIHPAWPVADAFLCADYNKKTHFMPPTSNNQINTMCVLPGFMISGDLGNQIKQNLSANVNFLIHQYNKKDFPSKNVIVTIPGTSEEIIFIGSKLDSMPCRGAADDSGSISIVWGVAKYFAENKIKLNYTLKFGAWAAEEFGRAGSKSYIETNSDENIKYYIGLGAIGYKNNSKTAKSDLHLNIHSTDDIEPSLYELISKYDYTDKSGGYGDIVFKKNDPMITKTDAGSFIKHASKNVFSIDKGDYSTATHWYHRSGSTHNYGDVPSVLDNQDIKAVAELIIEIVTHLNS